MSTDILTYTPLGVPYEYTVYPDGVQWNHVPIIYLMLTRGGLLGRRVVYVGQADNAATRMPGHEKLERARALGMTHIAARVVRDAAQRDREEKALIELLRPVLNVQHNPDARAAPAATPSTPPLGGVATNMLFGLGSLKQQTASRTLARGDLLSGGLASLYQEPPPRNALAELLKKLPERR